MQCIFYLLKTGLGFIIFLIPFIFISLQCPFMLGDPDNFTEANPLVTPELQNDTFYLPVQSYARSLIN
jgi:ubiquinol-cytochrome c reductase cytochrome b subunit